MRWYPTTPTGRISLWVGVSAFAIVYLQYWSALLTGLSVPPVSGIAVVALLIAAGVGAAIASLKHRDRAILVYLPVLLGLLGVAFVVGELLFPH